MHDGVASRRHWSAMRVHGGEGVGCALVETEEVGGVVRDARDKGPPVPFLRRVC